MQASALLPLDAESGDERPTLWLDCSTDLEIFLIHICASNAEANKFFLFESLPYEYLFLLINAYFPDLGFLFSQ